MRRRHALLLGSAIALVGAAPAPAAEVEIKALDTLAWDPPTVAIAPGDTVVWSFAGTQGIHNVMSTSGNWNYRSGDPIASAPSGSFVFTTAGSYDFMCQVHPDMRGVVTVGDAPPPPPPPPGQQPFLNDSTPPTVFETGGLDRTPPKLSSVRVRRLSSGARIRFRVSERALVTVRFKRGGKTVKTAKFNASGSYRGTFRKGMRTGRYRVELRAEDVAGNRSGPRTVRLIVR